jgi:hypothetical protein
MSEVAPSIGPIVPRKRRTQRIVALTIATILVLVVLHWLLFQGDEIVPGVMARPVGPCDVEWFERWGGAIILACPRTDLIKLWPLPVQQPWYEDPLYPQRTAEITENTNSDPPNALLPRYPAMPN